MNQPILFEFAPFSNKQKMLLHWWKEGSPHKEKDIVIADGAIRSGKTIAMICSFLEWSLNSFDGFNFIVAGKSMGALKRNVVQPMRQILTTWGIEHEYNRSNNHIIVGNNTYYLFGANNEASQDVLQGLTAAGSYADEVALFPRSFVEQMMGRCSVEGSKIFLNCNPRGPYHWFKLEYIDMRESKNVYYLHFDLDDNLTLSEKTKEKYRTRFTGVFFRRYILGLWVLAEGVIYSMFERVRHIVKAIPIEERLDPYTHVKHTNVKRRFVGIDYGQNNPTAFVLVTELTDGTIYVEREHRARSITNSAKVDELVRFIGTDTVNGIIVDPSALAFIDEIKVQTTYRVIAANNDVVDGISSVANLFALDRLFVCASCKEIQKEIESYVWDEKAQERGEDRPVKAFDHFLDAIRYVIFTVYGKVSKVRVHDKYAAGVR